jgi:8-hydroxy-5-deazaflavin:NADPH oxidoreductase
MTTIGFIGSGNIGGTVARLAVAAGHQVVLSNSRGPQTLADLVAEIGPLASAGTVERAATAGDLVVVSIPVKAVTTLPSAALAGKTVIDTGNYYPGRDGQIPELDGKELTEAEYTQRFIPGALVVKAFNNIFFKHLQNLARPAGAADRSYLPIAGDSEPAKAAVAGFLDEIGYGTVDVGSLKESWRQQPGTPAYGPPYGTFENEKGQPASEDVIRAALAAATR